MNEKRQFYDFLKKHMHTCVCCSVSFAEGLSMDHNENVTFDIKKILDTNRQNMGFITGLFQYFLDIV